MPIPTPTVTGILANPFYISVDVNATGSNSSDIHPGQPVTISWGIYGYRLRPDGGEEPEFADAAATVLLDGVTVWGPSSERSVTLTRTMLGNAFYQLHGAAFATKQLVITAEGGPDHSHFRLTLPITVWADAPPTWQWDASPSAFRWKQDQYTLSGKFQTQSRFAAVTVTPVLSEQNTDSVNPLPSRTISPSSATLSIPPAGEVELAFPPIQQSWQWLDQVFIVPVGPQRREFSYIVQLSALDEFGNAFFGGEVFDPADFFNLQVFVTDLKWFEAFDVGANAQINAVGATIIAGILAATIWTSPAALISLGVAATLEAVARAAVTSALDPPIPDFDFFKPAPGEVLRSTLTPADSQFQSADEAAYQLRRIMEAVSSLGQIESRLYGATLAKNTKAFAIQQSAYADMVTRIGDAAVLLSDAATKILDLKIDEKAFHAVADILQQQYPIELRMELTKAGLPAEAIQALEAATKAMPRKMLLESCRQFKNNFNMLSERSSAIASDLRAQAPQVIKRYLNMSNT
jgi:hypothetical protein